MHFPFSVCEATENARARLIARIIMATKSSIGASTCPRFFPAENFFKRVSPLSPRRTVQPMTVTVSEK
jgi:hypothetical protein